MKSDAVAIRLREIADLIAVAAPDLSPMETVFLNLLATAEPDACTPARVAQSMGLDFQGVSAVVAMLVFKSYIVGPTDPNWNGGVVMQLSSKARSILSQDTAGRLARSIDLLSSAHRLELERSLSLIHGRLLPEADQAVS